MLYFCFFFFNVTATTEIYTLSLHDVFRSVVVASRALETLRLRREVRSLKQLAPHADRLDRKSTRLNSSHTVISYAVFCLKKKMSIIMHLGSLFLSAELHGGKLVLVLNSGV